MIKRFGMWLVWCIDGYSPPSLAYDGLRPTLRWVLTGDQ